MKPEHKKHAGNAAQLTCSPVQIPTQSPITATRPEWIRLPKPGTLCPWSGLSRNKLWEVLQTDKVRNICLRKDDATPEAMLIHLPTLLTYVDSPENEHALSGDDEEAAALTSESSKPSEQKGLARNDWLFPEEPSGQPSLPSGVERNFFAHSKRQGRRLLAMMAEAMDQRQYSEPCGSDTLPRHLRFAHPDRFTMPNNFAPWYMAALVICRPDLSNRVIHDQAKFERLLELNWKLTPLQGG